VTEGKAPHHAELFCFSPHLNCATKQYLRGVGCSAGFYRETWGLEMPRLIGSAMISTKNRLFERCVALQKIALRLLQEQDRLRFCEYA
jgi:hypothetical protein